MRGRREGGEELVEREKRRVQERKSKVGEEGKVGNGGGGRGERGGIERE
jgi:hypothetical protein